MRIHFCDLCNESVPEADFSTGKAFLRKGRVICATCEALMSAEDEAQAAAGTRPVIEPLGLEYAVAGGASSPASPPPAGPAHPSAGHSPAVRAARRNPGGGWIGLVALGFACVGAWFLSGRLDELRQDQGQLRSEIDRRAERNSRDLDEFSGRARERTAELERRVNDVLVAELASTTALLGQLRDDLARSTARQDELELQIGQLAKDQLEGDREVGRRFDDLTARSIRSREDLDDFRARLDEAETSLAAGGAPIAVAAAPDQVAPKWAAELADLSSTNAGSRWNAVQALGETGDPAVIPYLIPVLQDSDVFVRMAVARVLGDLGAPEAIEPLINALEDEEPVVREASMVSLHAISGRNFRFDPMASKAERDKKVKDWRKWWSRAREDYFGDA